MNLSTMRYETERLVLVSMAPQFREQLFANLSPEIVTYMYLDSATDISETDAFIANSVERNRTGADWEIAVTEKETGEFLGGAIVMRPASPTPELGIWIKTSAHGNGYGLEAVGGLIAWARENLTFDYLTYPVDRRNGVSRRIPEHFGAEVRHEFKYVKTTGEELDLLEYWIY